MSHFSVIIYIFSEHTQKISFSGYAYLADANWSAPSLHGLYFLFLDVYIARGIIAKHILCTQFGCAANAPSGILKSLFPIFDTFNQHFATL